MGLILAPRRHPQRLDSSVFAAVPRKLRGDRSGRRGEGLRGTRILAPSGGSRGPVSGLHPADRCRQIMSSTDRSDASDRRSARPATEYGAVGVSPRRGFLGLAALTCLAGCAAPQRKSAALPAGDWAALPTAGPTPQPVAAPLSDPSVSGVSVAGFSGVRPRSAWARGGPDPSVMNPMLPVRYVTVHHDGLEQLCTGTAEGEMAARIDLYRVGHRAKGWGDIGYHFVIDRCGVVWEGRNLRWQGAHVKDRNEGNIGILVMGNFEVQRPTPAQLNSLKGHLLVVCQAYNVPWTRVFSHQEWPGAQTLCPGRNLQREFIRIRQIERA
jgi:hypothetical protein